MRLAIFPGCRRIYWSDCASPVTIRSARIEDEGDHRILISAIIPCIVGIAIDFDGTTSIHTSLAVITKLTL